MQEHRNIVDLSMNKPHPKIDFLAAEHSLDLDVDAFVNEFLRSIGEHGVQSPPEYILALAAQVFEAGKIYTFGEYFGRISKDGKTFSFWPRGQDELRDSVTFEMREINGYLRAFRQRIQDRFCAKGADNWHVRDEARGGNVHMLHSDRILRKLHLHEDSPRDLPFRIREAKRSLLSTTFLNAHSIYLIQNSGTIKISQKLWREKEIFPH